MSPRRMHLSPFVLLNFSEIWQLPYASVSVTAKLSKPKTLRTYLTQTHIPNMCFYFEEGTTGNLATITHVHAWQEMHTQPRASLARLPLGSAKISLTRAHARDRLEKRDDLKSWCSEWRVGRSAHKSQTPGRISTTLSAEQRAISTSAFDN
jgi:hypothetical protein